MSTSLIIIILSTIGIVCGILIFMVNRFLPREPESLKKTEEISGHLPGVNCGACGYPGCFAYAQALTKDKNIFFTNTCATVLQEPGMLKGLEKTLGIEVDSSKINKKAVVRCYGNSGVIGNYSGIKTCNAASKLLGGYKECPYGCLGLGDCIAVCPNGAISIDEKMNVAVIDPDKCIGCGLCVAECHKNIIQLVPADSNIVYLCSYQPLKNIPGREKCDVGCLHCKKCFKTCENGAIIWNEEKAIPEFDFTRCTLCGKCIEACPHDRLIELSNVALKEKAGILKDKEKNKRR
ncbi:MAG: 4Fe-4S binding protein [Actinobacteria bacterium]|nr:4Fe-4S binding protein [Actinomycetota bacterium]MBL7124380.1 4Fe-4S binding protein [Actinomycetota bacterium]